MYKAFYGLTRSPFGTSPDPEFLYLMPQTRETLACLEHGIMSRKGFVALTGEVGTGKTTLLRHAIESLRGHTVHTAFVFNPRMDVLDFLEFVLSDFGLPVVNRSKASMLMQLNRWLIECYSREEICVLIIDEAQDLSLEMLEEIRLLTNLETASQKLLQIVLSGQPELEAHLRSPSVRQVRQRIALWSRTHLLTPEETAEYIARRLSIAGTETRIFSPEAIAAIHLFSHGTPRLINVLCEHALIYGYVEQERTIAPIAVFLAAADLGLEANADETQSPWWEKRNAPPEGLERERSDR